MQLRYRSARNKVQGSMSVANNKDPKQPGEKESGKYHYNPGNMSEKTIDVANRNPSSEQILTG
jgi:hypothetical protein